jgi:hypothetical protein
MSAEARFWSRVDTSGECWVWTGPKNPLGYGVAGHKKVPGRDRLTHRFAWQMTNGPIPPGLYVLHHCDNPPCVNPDHLWLGTIADNNRDRNIKGRDARGEGNANAKLTVMDVQNIRAAHSQGVGLNAISRTFGISPAQAHRVTSRRSWAQVA